MMRTNLGEKLTKAMNNAPAAQQPPKLVDSDGKSHINVDNYGKTDLGRKLSHFAKSYFKHPIYGPFHSLQGFLEWIRTTQRPDALRRVHGRVAKEMGKDYPAKQRIANFRQEITMAAWYKITQNDKLLAAVMQSSLPFKSYYLYGPQKIEIGADDDRWFVESLERIRHHLKVHGPSVPFDYENDIPEDEGCSSPSVTADADSSTQSNTGANDDSEIRTAA